MRVGSQDGGGVGRGEHFLPHKFIKRAFKRRVNSTKQLLNTGRGHQAPEYWSISFSITSSNEYLGLISFRIDWFDLLAVQGTVTSLFQHYNSGASVLWCSACFMVQLSYPYTTTGKTMSDYIDLCQQSHVSAF